MNKLIDTFSRKQLRKVADDGGLSREMTSIKQCSKIGIIYNARKQQDAVDKFKSWLMNYGIKVISLGFVDEKVLPSEFSPNYKTDFFCRRNLDRWRLPKTEDVNRFLLEHFDYLIGVFDEAEIPLMGIAAQSKAQFRIGPFHPDFIHCFDMMLQVHDNEIDDYLRSVKNYLLSYGK